MRAPSTKSDFPWWLAVAVLLALAAAVFIATSNLYAQVFATVAKGIGITIFVTVVAFALASAIGLGIALMGLSGSAGCARSRGFYVEIIRGVPILVLLFCDRLRRRAGLRRRLERADRAAQRPVCFGDSSSATSRSCGGRSWR